MKLLREKIISSILFSLLFHLSYGQNIGLRANTEFSDNGKINNSFGGGLFLNLNDFSKKLELLFSIDYNRKYKEFSNESFSSLYKRLYFSTGCLYVFSITEKLKIKLGPSFSYDIITANEQGLISNWINTFKSNFIGSSLMTNIQFQNIFKLPVNLDLFVSPSYLMNVKNNNDPTGIKSDYSNNLTLLNIQLGISYKIK